MKPKNSMNVLNKHRRVFVGMITKCYLEGIIEDDLVTKKREVTEVLYEVEKSQAVGI